MNRPPAGERRFHFGNGLSEAGAGTLCELMEARAAAAPERYLDFHGGETLHFTQLYERASHYAGVLQRRGLQPGERVLLLLPTCPEFVYSLFGTMLAGGVPVPVYPPPGLKGLDTYLVRQERIAASCGAAMMITNARLARVCGLIEAGTRSLRAIHTVEAIHATVPSQARPVEVGPDSLALIQYTSGSTGGQKGVALTHSNILSNAKALAAGLQFQPGDRMVNWLPLYHDMGLIGMVMVPLCCATPTYMMAPFDFLRDPRSWLEAISTYQGAVSVAPNFAFAYTLKRMERDDLAGLDLSSWRVCFNGAEPVSADVLDAFTRRFEPVGFRPTTFSPVYGMAENCLIVTCPDHRDLPVVDHIDREVFEVTGDARPPEEGARVKAVVGVGTAVLGTELRVVDPEGVPRPDRREGQVEIRGDSLLQGYFRNEEATREAFRDGWFRTGDLGYLADGQLFVTGRTKDLIIRNGINYYPQDVEVAAEQVPGVRRGCTVAFAVWDEDAGSERMVVVVESKEISSEARVSLVEAVSAAISEDLGCRPDDVVVVPPRTVPKTSSGKLQRATSRSRYLDGSLAPPAGVATSVARAVTQHVVPFVRKRLSAPE